MNLWLSCLLFASLLLSSSALTTEECQPLVSPMSLADPSVFYGKVNFLAGYTDHEFYKSMLKITDSSWVNITGSPADNTQLFFHQGNKINGTCMKQTMRVNIEGNTLKSSYFNMTLEEHVLPSFEGSWAILINSTTKSAQSLLRLFKTSHSHIPDEISARSLYLLGREQTLSEANLEHFKKQASCLGFSGELDFHYNPEKSFCKDDEGIELPNSL